MREVKFKAILKRESYPRDVFAIDFLNLKVIVSISGSHEWHEYKELIQFTGLLDKNGVEIYEGDILQHPASKEIFVVKWSDAYSGFKALYQNDDIYNGATLILQINEKGLAEVIGNVYENEDLLNN